MSFSRPIDQEEETERRSERNILMQSEAQSHVNHAAAPRSEELIESEVKTLHVVARVTNPTGPNPLHN